MRLCLRAFVQTTIHDPKVLCRSEWYVNTSDCYNEKALGEDPKAVAHFREIKFFFPKTCSVFSVVFVHFWLLRSSFVGISES